jgi:hypothetical protein
VHPDADLLAELGRHLRSADALLAGLADDMAAAGAATASERAERVRAELRAAEEIAIRLQALGSDTTAW